MLHRGEGIGGGATHPHGGGGWGVVLGVLLLQVQQLVEELVVFKVADFRVILVVIPVGVVLHLGTERFDLLQDGVLLDICHFPHLILTGAA